MRTHDISKQLKSKFGMRSSVQWKYRMFIFNTPVKAKENRLKVTRVSSLISYHYHQRISSLISYHQHQRVSSLISYHQHQDSWRWFVFYSTNRVVPLKVHAHFIFVIIESRLNTVIKSHGQIELSQTLPLLWLIVPP